MYSVTDYSPPSEETKALLARWLAEDGPLFVNCGASLAAGSAPPLITTTNEYDHVIVFGRKDRQ